MDINKKIREVKERVKDLTKHFPYNTFEINMLTICYLAISSIDNDITDILDETLSRIFILFNYGGFDDFLNDLGIGLDEGGGFIVSGFDLNGKDNYEFIYINVNKTKDFLDGDINISNFLCYLIHELKHALNEIVNSYKKIDGNTYFYTGLSTYKYDSNCQDLTLLDEAFNCFITDIYLEQIFNLKNVNIEDSEIKRILDSYDYDCQGIYPYDSTYLLEPLFLDSTIFKAFYNATIYKDYKPLLTLLSKVFNCKFNSMYDVNFKFNAYFEKFEAEGGNEIPEYFDKFTKDYPKRELKIKSYFDNI